MILIIHPKDLSELQELLLAAAIYLDLENELEDGKKSKVVNEVDPAELMGKQFDKLYDYDNSHNNIHDALNFDWDES